VAELQPKQSRLRWIAALLFGISASGLWDVAVKPLFLALFHGILTGLRRFGR